MSECLSCSAIIVDDHPLARMAIRSVLEKQRITIINEYEDVGKNGGGYCRCGR